MDIDSKQAVVAEKCAVERFLGQTVLYLPLEIGDLVGEEEWKPLVEKHFPAQLHRADMPAVYRLAIAQPKDGGSTQVRDLPRGEMGKLEELACYEVVIPGVLDFSIQCEPVERNLLYDIPNRIIDEILSRK